ERIAEGAPDLAEKLPGEVGLVAVPQEGFPVKGVNPVEQVLVEVAAETGLEADPGLGHAPALAPRLLALLRREGLEIGLEARVATIAPVELAVAPQQPTPPLAGDARGLIDEEGVHGGQPPTCRVCLERLEQTLRRRARIESLAHQEARPGCRGERHGDDELRIVTPAMARISLGPGEIEDELTVGVAFDVGRRSRRESLLVAQGDGAGLPPRTRADAAGVLEGREELVAQERAVGSPERVPLARSDVVDAGVDLGSHHSRRLPRSRLPSRESLHRSR